MTARRRRKSGSGPSASALIAWVGGTRVGFATHEGAPISMIDDAPADRVAGGRAVLLGRACGLTAGTLLAFGSVLIGATNVGDGSLAGESAPLLNPLPALAVPNATAPAEPVSAVPDQVSAQAVTGPAQTLHPRLGQVRRNAPRSFGVSAEEPSTDPGTAQQVGTPPPSAQGHTPPGSITPVSPGQVNPGPVNPGPVNPVLDPATQGVDRVLAPKNPSMQRSERATGFSREARLAKPRDKRASLTRHGPVETVKQVVVPVNEVIRPAMRRVIKPAVQPIVQPVSQAVTQPVARPAMAMLTSLLPIG
jgi:hypothetical protein